MIELKGMTWDHPRGHAPLLAASERYANEHGLSVTWEARSLKDFGDASLERLAGEYDLIVMDHPHVGVAAQSGMLVPFDDLSSNEALEALAGESVGPSFTSYHYHGRQWALPVDAACQVGAFRPDLFDAVELPTNWNEVFACAENLRRQGRWMGMALSPTDVMCSFLTMTAQLGDAIQETDPRWVKEETTLTALECLARLRDVSHPQSMEWNPIHLYDAMASGERIVYSPLAFGYINYTGEGFREHPLAFSGIPGESGSLLGGAGIAISHRVEEREAAAAYCLRVCGSQCQADTYLVHGGQPGNASAWQLPDNHPRVENFLRPTFETIKRAYRRPRFPGWPAFQEALGERLHVFLKTGGNPVHVHGESESLFMQMLKNDEII